MNGELSVMNEATQSNCRRITRICAAVRITFCALFLFTVQLSIFNPAQAQETFTRTHNTTTTTSGTTHHNSSANPIFTNDTLRGDTTEVEKGIMYKKEIPDSVLRKKVFSFLHFHAQPKIMQLWNPTLDPTGIQFTEPLDALNGNYYLGKGIVGQPHVAIYPTLSDGLAMQLQPDPNIGYVKRSNNIRFYQTMTPYTVLSYNSSLNKDYVVRVTHTQNIKPGWNAAFDYRLFSPEGVYTSSGDKNHYLDATMNYFSRDSRLQAHGGVIWQSFNIDENGGISDDSYFTSSIQSNRAGIPVNLYNMGTRHREFTAFADASYSLVRQFERYNYRDSLVARTVNDSTTVMDTIKLVDTIPAANPHTFNLGRFGIEIIYDRRKRVFTDSTLWQESSATLYWTNDIYPDHRWRNPLKLTLGLQPRIVSAIIERDSLAFYSMLDPFARAEVAVGRGTLRGEAEMRGSFSNTKTDSRFLLAFDYPFDSARNTMASLIVVKQSKCLDLRMVRDAIKYTDDKPRAIGSAFAEARFNHRDIIDISLKANHLDHNAWYEYGSRLFLREGESDLWLFQGSLTLRLAIGWFHIDMQQLVQHTTDEVQMPVPLWASKNSLYADFYLFHRTVRAQIGTDLRYHTPFFAPGYDYATGIFYHQDETAVGGYLWADFFINLNVKRASFYVKAGHLNALWDQPNYFLLPHYPGQRFGLFWGITWHFFD